MTAADVGARTVSGIAGGSPRYPGATPFSDSEVDRSLFHGRDLEAHALLHAILSERLVVVYGASGTGKTSLLKARIVQELRDRDMWPFIVRLQHPTRPLVEQVAEQVRHQVPDEVELILPESPDGGLWGLFAGLEVWRGDTLLTAVLILDQFEELFAPEWARDQQTAFFSDFAELVHGRRRPAGSTGASARPLRLHIVVCLREDSLGELEDLAVTVPAILRHRFRLKPLDVDQARAATIQPAGLDDPRLATPPFRYADSAVDLITRYLQTRREPGRSVRTPTVEPTQLQIVCQYVEEVVVPAKREQQPDEEQIDVTAEDLGGEEGLDQILEDFYARQLGRFAEGRRAAIGRLCESGLISPTRRRMSREQGEIGREYGVTATELGQLVEQRLVRAEPRLGTAYYELAHDSLVRPILAYRDRRQAAARERRNTVIGGLVGTFVTVVVVSALLFGFFGSRTGRGPTVLAGDLSARGDFAGVEVVPGGVVEPGTDLSRIDLAGATLREVTFRGVVLADASLVGADLTDADLTDADLAGADLTGATVDGVDFVLATLRNATLAGLDLSDAELAGLDLSGANLKEAKLDGADLRRANLSGADLTGVAIKDADLSGANLSRAMLRGVDLKSTELTGAMLRGATLAGLDLSEAGLSGLDLSSASLENADLRRADLTSANLEGADLTGAAVAGARLDGAVLARATLSGLELAGARLAGLNLSRANLTGADLTRADLAGADLNRADLTGASVTDAEFGGAVLAGATLAGLDLAGARLAGLDLTQGNLTGADLTDADLTDADLTGADLAGAIVTGADFARASLVATSLAGADLSGASLGSLDLSGANFVSANLSRANLRAAVLEDALLMGARLSRADLANARLDRADLSQADLSDATLSGASLMDAVLADASLRGAALIGADLSGAKLTRADFTDAVVGGADFTEADLTGALVGFVVASDDTVWPEGYVLPGPTVGQPEVLAVHPTGGKPVVVSAGADGIWVAAGSGGVACIDPATSSLFPTEFFDAASVAAGPGGGAWALERFERAVELVRIDACGSPPGPVAMWDVGDADQVDVAVGEGWVWVVAGRSGEVGRLFRIDPNDPDRIPDTVEVGRFPVEVTVGAGAVWVANLDDDTVSRVDPDELTATAYPAGDEPLGLAVGPDALWVANRSADTVTRLELGEPGGESVTIPVGANPDGVAIGPDGGPVWVTNAVGDTLSRIDPGTLAVDAVIEVGDRPDGVAVGLGFVWVANSFEGTVAQVEPGR